ncbi:FR47-like protein [Musa troglodytarum]|uniref:FR47-like protein n=1 Tax=Musa troglodytarum TaxID=320322 RepID=A0A9E7HB30_9LILI|nr:FR47-like protein [Musa troglodytarum]
MALLSSAAAPPSARRPTGPLQSFLLLLPKLRCSLNPGTRISSTLRREAPAKSLFLSSEVRYLRKRRGSPRGDVRPAASHLCEQERLAFDRSFLSVGEAMSDDELWSAIHLRVRTFYNFNESYGIEDYKAYVAKREFEGLKDRIAGKTMGYRKASCINATLPISAYGGSIDELCSICKFSKKEGDRVVVGTLDINWCLQMADELTGKRPKDLKPVKRFTYLSLLPVLALKNSLHHMVIIQRSSGSSCPRLAVSEQAKSCSQFTCSCSLSCPRREAGLISPSPPRGTVDNRSGKDEARRTWKVAAAALTHGLAMVIRKFIAGGAYDGLPHSDMPKQLSRGVEWRENTCEGQGPLSHMLPSASGGDEAMEVHQLLRFPHLILPSSRCIRSLASLQVGALLGAMQISICSKTITSVGELFQKKSGINYSWSLHIMKVVFQPKPSYLHGFLPSSGDGYLMVHEEAWGSNVEPKAESNRHQPHRCHTT